ncbi:hypothetical protein C6376_29255 [Streptomyces sp. P3]|nr:hypothetical protein C6376_29255 [Streptomyces sp. P3]
MGSVSVAREADVTRDQATCEELATAWGRFLESDEPGRPAFDSAQPESTRLIGGAVTFVTEPADDIVGSWIHGS